MTANQNIADRATWSQSAAAAQPERPGKLLVYGDFTCPGCFLASSRIDALKAVGVDIEWRAVEVHPDLPVMGVPLEGAASAAVDQARSAVAGRLLSGELLSWKKPALRPHTQAAVAAFAEADGAGVADDVRRLLIGAYWTRGANIGDPEVLRRLIAGAIMRGHSTSDPLQRFGYAVSLSRGPITTGAYRRIRNWQAQWKDLEAPDDVALMEPQGVSSGLDALDRLAALIKERGAPLSPSWADPGRYPAVRVDPPQGWSPGIAAG